MKNRNKIKAKLAEAGISQADIARSLVPPVTISAVSRTLAGTSVSKRIMAEVASRLKTDPEQLWSNAA